MPISLITVEFNVGAVQAIRYAYAKPTKHVGGGAVASLTENSGLPTVADFYCARREMLGGINGTDPRWAHEIKVRLASPAGVAGRVVVSVFDPEVELETLPWNQFHSWPSGERA